MNKLRYNYKHIAIDINTISLEGFNIVRGKKFNTNAIKINGIFLKPDKNDYVIHTKIAQKDLKEKLRAIERR